MEYKVLHHKQAEQGGIESRRTLVKGSEPWRIDRKSRSKICAEVESATRSQVLCARQSGKT